MENEHRGEASDAYIKRYNSEKHVKKTRKKTTKKKTTKKKTAKKKTTKNKKSTKSQDTMPNNNVIGWIERELR